MGGLNALVDRYFPPASRGYRRARDYLQFKWRKPYQTRFGFQLFGDAGLDQSRSEAGETACFQSCLKPVDVVLDVGANVGLFTCLAAQAGKPVLAFEPHPLNLQWLYRNLLMNHFDGPEVFPMAISNRAGVMPLFGGGQGASLIPGWSGMNSTYKTIVPVNTLDNVASGRFREQLILFKMDVEGNEFDALQGATTLLDQTPAPMWIIEHGLKENFGGGINPHFQELFQLFWTRGYSAFSIDSEERPVTPQDVDRWLARGERDSGSLNFLFKRASV
jgi:FkbM family methyltransferase